MGQAVVREQDATFVFSHCCATARCDEALSRRCGDGLLRYETTWDDMDGSTADLSDGTEQSSSSRLDSNSREFSQADVVVGFGAMSTAAEAAGGAVGRRRVATATEVAPALVQAFPVLAARSVGKADRLAPVSGEPANAGKAPRKAGRATSRGRPDVELWPPRILEYVSFDDAKRFRPTCRAAQIVLDACLSRDPPKAPLTRYRSLPRSV